MEGALEIMKPSDQLKSRGERPEEQERCTLHGNASWCCRI